MKTARFSVAYSALAMWLTPPDERPAMHEWVTSDLPKDLQILRLRDHPDYQGYVELIAASEQFADVPEGHVIPEIFPSFTRHSLPCESPP